MNVRTVMGMVLITVMMASMQQCESIGIRGVRGRVPRKRLSLRTPTSNKRYDLDVDVDADGNIMLTVIVHKQTNPLLLIWRA